VSAKKLSYEEACPRMTLQEAIRELEKMLRTNEQRREQAKDLDSQAFLDGRVSGLRCAQDTIKAIKVGGE
jgi:hypothetical protein